MKFTCIKDNLSKGISIVFKAIATKSTLPILTNILITVQDGRVKLSAFNLDSSTGISTFVGAAVETEGTITVPAKLFRDYISMINQETIILEVIDDVLHITTDKTSSKINGTPAEGFPKLVSFEQSLAYIELDAQTFATAVAFVGYAAALDSARPVFTGVFMKVDKDMLTFAATDGFRLSEKILKLDKEYPSFAAIIPAKILTEVSKVFGSNDTKIKCAMSKAENVVIFTDDFTTISTGIISGEYPDYKRIVPKDAVLMATIPTADILEGVKLTSLFEQDDNSYIKMHFDTEGFLTITSLQNEAGTHNSKIQIETNNVEIKLAIKSKYLLDFLNTVKSQQIKLEAVNSTVPCIVKPSDAENFFHLIMPMQIKG